MSGFELNNDSQDSSEISKSNEVLGSRNSVPQSATPTPEQVLEVLETLNVKQSLRQLARAMSVEEGPVATILTYLKGTGKVRQRVDDGVVFYEATEPVELDSSGSSDEDESQDAERMTPTVGDLNHLNSVAGSTIASPPVPEDWPEPLAVEAFYGLAGEAIKAIEPHSEADPAALLVQFLICFGNAIGRSAAFSVGGARHFANEYVVLVGDTAKGRKGQAWAEIDALFRIVDPTWAAQ